MTKQDALDATVRKFTNLYDGSVIPRAGVRTIIEHYEALLANANPAPINDHSHFIQNFIEEEIREMEDDDYLDSYGYNYPGPGGL